MKSTNTNFSLRKIHDYTINLLFYDKIGDLFYIYLIEVNFLFIKK